MSLPAPFSSFGMTINNTLGVGFLGVVVAAIFFGITTLQMYLYFHYFPKDSMLHKVSVGILWSLDALHLIVTIHAVYFYLVTHYGAFTLEVVWSVKLQILINVIVILVTQSLYAYRVWRLGGYHHGVLGYVVASVVTGGFVIGVLLTYETFSFKTFSDVANVSWAVYSSFAASTSIDFIISMAMCYYLKKSQGAQSRLNSRISTIMQYTLGSGLLTSACSLSCLFAYALSPNTLIYLGLEFILTQLYVGSFLAMLNARKRSDNRRSTEFSSSAVSMPSLTVKSSASRAFLGGPSPISASSERKYPWEADLEGGRPEIAMHPTRHYVTSPQDKPNYAQRW